MNKTSLCLQRMRKLHILVWSGFLFVVNKLVKRCSLLIQMFAFCIYESIGTKYLFGQTDELDIIPLTTERLHTFTIDEDMASVKSMAHTNTKSRIVLCKHNHNTDPLHKVYHLEIITVLNTTLRSQGYICKIWKHKVNGTIKDIQKLILELEC